MSMQMTSNSDFKTSLYDCSNLSCVDVYGPDAITFLQSQLTQDLNLVTKNRAALAGYCSAQGRMLASMLFVPTEQLDRIRLIIRSDLTEGLIKRLRMFVLRSKVSIELQTHLNVYGLILPSSSSTLNETAVWATKKNNAQLWVRAPSADNNFARCWIICESSDMPINIMAELQANATAWEVEDILAGIPWIQDATRDLFIPQSVNLDLVEGVSFTKGCYPGQEVVARAHYRSKVKRRMHAAKITPAHPQIQAGSDVHPAGSPDDPCGRIIQVAHMPTASYVLFEAPDKAIAAGPLSTAQANDAELKLLDLPYSTQAAE